MPPRDLPHTQWCMLKSDHIFNSDNFFARTVELAAGALGAGQHVGVAGLSCMPGWQGLFCTHLCMLDRNASRVLA